MSAEQVDSAFCLAGEGRWGSELVGHHQTLFFRFERGSGSQVEVLRAAFEIHDARLMVIRVVVVASNALAHGGDVEITPLTVVGREQRADGAVEYRLLARECTARTGEIGLLLARGGASGP
jgi:hypothetical protein